MSYQDEAYLLRLSVADKVKPGTVETLAQDMKRRNIPKGLVITSTEFTSDAQKSGKGRKNIVLIDGQTLFDIAEH
jgi:restriction endonuclease Mrr